MQVSITNQKNTNASIRNLETQVGQLAKQMAKQHSDRQQFSANTQTNSKEHYKSITTRSGKVISRGIDENLAIEEEVIEEIEAEKRENVIRETQKGKHVQAEEGIMIESLVGQEFYCFLDGYSGYNQISIDPDDQEKIAFKYPFGIFAYRKMSFRLCNAPTTFQSCMSAIFSDLVELCLKVFMDDFLVFGSSFEVCLANLDIMLRRFLETNLVLNWKKCHFMVTEGVVMGHKISSWGIEVGEAKIEIIKELPPPLNVKGIKGFLGHTDFELMCDANDYDVKVVLGQRKSKEFDLEIKDKKGSENYVADHLSRLVNQEVTVKEAEVVEEFPDEKLILIQERPWFVDIANFKAARVIPNEFKWHQKKKLLRESHQYVWDDPHLYKIGSDGLLRRCISSVGAKIILWHGHSSPYGGHFNGERTIAKVLQSGFYWPVVFKDAQKFAQQCDNYQRSGGISKRNEMPLSRIQEIEVFDCWGIDFMGPFPPSHSHLYILVALDYVSKWVEVAVAPKDDANTIVEFLKRNIFSRFGTPRVLISDGGSHLCNSQLEKVLQHYGVWHKVASPYHPQTNGHAKVSNREIKRILEKTVSISKKDWSLRLDDAL
ncbi:PREDICTED: uncharacterized protein K02A2.6-like [Lupinus angustifolius]|uniref:uncharacterized protein K02A2.6-like n=1 Tax=Lupinus angustifolius TaxID=3871 RepID=UPI00092F333C|nr:PREDICTED: uncharacterized protein K02A2.6-like [Lupinus angustifolius]